MSERRETLQKLSSIKTCVSKLVETSIKLEVIYPDSWIAELQKSYTTSEESPFFLLLGGKIKGRLCQQGNSLWNWSLSALYLFLKLGSSQNFIHKLTEDQPSNLKSTKKNPFCMETVTGMCISFYCVTTEKSKTFPCLRRESFFFFQYICLNIFFYIPSKNHSLFIIFSYFSLHPRNFTKFMDIFLKLHNSLFSLSVIAHIILVNFFKHKNGKTVFTSHFISYCVDKLKDLVCQTRFLMWHEFWTIIILFQTFF